MDKQYVTIKLLAEELGMDRSHARRYVLRLGVKPEKRRTADSGGQQTLTVSEEEAEYIRRTRKEQGFLDSSKPISNEKGYFYVIQLIPELDPKRIKLGFADDVNNRLTQHRTAAPTAIILKAWPCKRSWESTIIDGLSSINGKLILNEVYEFGDLEALIVHADKLFSLLPDPSLKVPLANSSPHVSSNLNK